MTNTKLGVVSAAVLAVSLMAGSAFAQDSTPASRLPVTPKQRSTADQVAQAGVPLSALAPGRSSLCRPRSPPHRCHRSKPVAGNRIRRAASAAAAD